MYVKKQKEAPREITRDIFVQSGRKGGLKTQAYYQNNPEAMKEHLALIHLKSRIALRAKKLNRLISEGKFEEAKAQQILLDRAKSLDN